MAFCEFRFVKKYDRHPGHYYKVKEQNGANPPCFCGDKDLSGKVCPIALTAKQRLTPDEFQDRLDETVFPPKTSKN